MTSSFTPVQNLNSAVYRRPYLNLKEKLSQVILNPYTVFLGFLIIRLFFLGLSLNNSFNEAQVQTELLYNATQSKANDIVSFPHYMALGSNFVIGKSMNYANEGFIKSLSLIIEAAEQMIFFMIELSVGTYACLLTAAVHDSSIAALNSTEYVLNVANDTLKSFATDLNNGLSELTTVVNDIIDTVDDTGDALKHLFGDSSTDSTSLKYKEQMSHINLTIKNMQNWVIPASINSQIEKLKTEIPDFTDVKNYTETILALPFTQLKNEINGNLNKTFNSSLMYVPEKKYLNFEKGNDAINSFYNEVSLLAHLTIHIIMGVIGFAMLLFIFYCSLIEFRHWKKIQFASKQLCYNNESYNLPTKVKKMFNVEVVTVMQDGTSNFIGRFITLKILRLSNPIYINNARWLINYMSSKYLLPIFLLGVLGLVSSVCQLIVLFILKHFSLTDASDELFQSTAKELATSFNESVYSWTNETNKYLDNYQNEINVNLFGLVQKAATSINDTVTLFDTKMNSVIDDLFKGTPLYKPVEQVVWCVMESKIKKIEKAMTWLSEKAKIKMPNLDPKEIMNEMIQIETDKSTSSISNEVEIAKNKIKQVFTKIIEIYKREAFLLLYISLGVLAVWILFVLFGMMILGVREYQLQKKIPEKENYSPESSSFKSFPMTLETDKETEKTLLSLNSKKYLYGGLANMYEQLKNKIISKDGFEIPNSEQSKDIIELKRTLEKSNTMQESQIITASMCNSDSRQRMQQELETPLSGEADATLSAIGENESTLGHARKWSP
ncbi:pheromone-regulated protein [Martiniozyma asiatica (nom. inval.)]|nr:pheromone-regulated protein [Martiniozyma asiatica]